MALVEVIEAHRATEHPWTVEGTALLVSSESRRIDMEGGNRGRSSMESGIGRTYLTPKKTSQQIYMFHAKSSFKAPYKV
jgi:hypothetical protein